MCCKSITSVQVNEDNGFLMEFCKVFANLYGREHCAMNMQIVLRTMAQCTLFGVCLRANEWNFGVLSCEQPPYFLFEGC